MKALQSRDRVGAVVRVGAEPDAAKAFARCGNGTNGQDSLQKPDIVYWPTATAFDRQLVAVGIPFERKGEILVLERKSSGALTSRRATATEQMNCGIC